MNLNELIEALDQQFGNQYAPKRYLIIQEGIAALKSCEQLVVDALERGKAIGFAEGMKKAKE